MWQVCNNYILNRTLPKIQIADPSAANTLLDLALSSVRNKNWHVLFFCSCQWPRWDDGCCHRTEIAQLVLRAAKRRNEPIEIVEWPGGEPEEIRLELTPDVFKAVS